MRDLTPLFEPRSVALVGASSDRMKWGGWFADQPPRPGRPPAGPHGLAAGRRRVRPAGGAFAARPRRGARPGHPVDPGRRRGGCRRRCRAARREGGRGDRGRLRRDGRGGSGAAGPAGGDGAGGRHAAARPELPRPARHARRPERDRRRPADRRRLAGLAVGQPRARGRAAADSRAAGLRAVRLRRQPGRPDDPRHAVVAGRPRADAGRGVLRGGPEATGQSSWPPCGRWPRRASRRW